MSKNEENLRAAFAGESQARNKYTFFAKVAREAGLEQIAAVFEETADNEKAHAERTFKLLKALVDTKQNLRTAIEGEHYEHAEMYPRFEKVAREEGLTEIADFFKNLEENRVFKKDQVVRWKCRNCGYVHEGREAPKSFPACGYPQSYYELLCENY